MTETELWLNLIISAVVSTAVVLLIATVAARVRFSASRGLRTILDVLFFLPLLCPLEFLGGTCRNILLIEAGAMLPILYLCGILGFRKVDHETLDAARLQGLGTCGTFWRFFVPAAWQWLLGGAAGLLIRLLWVTSVLIAHMPRP